MTIPLPIREGEDERWNHTRLARRILYGTWESDLSQRVNRLINPQRKAAWGGSVDLSANLFRNLCDEVAVLYSSAPKVTHSNESGLNFAEHLKEIGIWSLMSRVQRDTIGLRECLVRIDIAGDGELSFTPVFPDMVTATSMGDKPTKPVIIEHLRKRVDSKGKECWVWDVFDISGDEPTYRVVTRDESGTEDVTEEFLGSRFDGQNYPYWFDDETPFIPFVIYHAAQTGDLFDAYSNRELVEGTLNVGVQYTFFGHVLRNASWPQRYGINIQPVGVINEDGVSSMVVDPTTVAMFENDSEGGSASVGQWQPGADPTQMIEAITIYERRLAAFAGVESSEVQRVSGDPRSGYALAVSREGKRQMQKRYAPQFRRGDLELIKKAAAISNAYAKTSYPLSGYGIVYTSIPRTPEEQAKISETTIRLLEVGLIDPVEAYMRIHDGSTREEALQAITSMLPSEDAPEGSTAISEPLSAPVVMNGAQVQAAQGVVQSVAQGQLPRDSGVQMLQAFFGLDKETADSVMGTVGKTFKPTTVAA